MNTLFLLMAEFNTPNIELSAVSQKYFGMSPATAKQKQTLVSCPFQHIASAHHKKQNVASIFKILRNT